MLPHLLANSKIQKHYQNQSKFNGFYWRNILSRKKDWPYATHLDKHESIGFYWIALYVNAKNITYFDSFGVENIPKENSLETKIL